MLVDGQIVEEGTHAELLEKGAHYSRYFDQQAEEALGANESLSPRLNPLNHQFDCLKSLERWVTEGWYADRQWTRWLLPLSWVFRGITSLRILASKAVYEPSIPVIVVGNLTVGGTGKTPVVAGLVNRLRARENGQVSFQEATLARKTGLLAWLTRKHGQRGWRRGGDAQTSVRRSHRHW